MLIQQKILMHFKTVVQKKLDTIVQRYLNMYWRKLRSDKKYIEPYIWDYLKSSFSLILVSSRLYNLQSGPVITWMLLSKFEVRNYWSVFWRTFTPQRIFSILATNNLRKEMLECFDFYCKAADQKRKHLLHIRYSKKPNTSERNVNCLNKTDNTVLLKML